MNRRFALILTIACLLVLVALTTGLVRAASGYDLSWWSVDGGGGISTNGYLLAGSVGQPDAGILTGTGYSLAGGFWVVGGPFSLPLYLPLIRR